jgi:hypothetical protein
MPNKSNVRYNFINPKRLTKINEANLKIATAIGKIV